MTNQIQKLIENLKKEIKNYDWKKAEQIFDETSLMFDTIETQREFFKFIEIKEKQAQLQFAEKLMKLRDKEEKERLNKLIEKIKEDVENWYKSLSYGTIVLPSKNKVADWKVCNKEDIENLNKILNETIEKCQK